MVTFGKRSVNGSIEIIRDGTRVGEIESSTYDRHSRKTGGGGYEVNIRFENRTLRDSDQILSDLKKRIVAFLA